MWKRKRKWTNKRLNPIVNGFVVVVEIGGEKRSLENGSVPSLIWRGEEIILCPRSCTNNHDQLIKATRAARLSLFVYNSYQI